MQQMICYIRIDYMNILLEGPAEGPSHFFFFLFFFGGGGARGQAVIQGHLNRIKSK